MENNSEIIYRETLERKPISGLKSFLIIVGIVFGSLALVLIVGFIQYLSGIGYLQFVLLGCVVVACFFAVKFFLTNYIYVILKDSVCVIRAVGKREKLISQFRYSDVVRYGKYDAEIVPYTYGRKKERVTYKKIDEDTDCIVLKDSFLLLNYTADFKTEFGAMMSRRGAASE